MGGARRQAKLRNGRPLQGGGVRKERGEKTPTRYVKASAKNWRVCATPPTTPGARYSLNRKKGEDLTNLQKAAKLIYKGPQLKNGASYLEN